MNSLWNKNITSFKNRFPALFEMYRNEINSFTSEKQEKELFSQIGYELFPARNGSICGMQNKIRLISAYNPEREALGSVTQPSVLEKSTLVFYGTGLGYHVTQWAKESLKQLTNSSENSSKDSSSKSVWNKKVLIIEPDIRYFFASLMILDWTKVFQIEKLIIALNCPPESILPLIEDTTRVNIGNTGVSDAFYFSIPVFTSHAQSYFDAVQTIIKRNQRKNKINEDTLKKFGKLWTKNSLKNLHFMEELTPINVFKNKNSDCLPFIILGAGPSLENILPYFDSIKNRAVTVCVETALPVLQKFNCSPDFIVLSDPQYWAYRHISGLKAEKSFLITEISTYPSVFRLPCKKILLCSSQFPIGQYFERITGEEGNLGTGGSVASTAWNFAYYCGAKSIYTSGLDLSFPGKQTHIKGSRAEQTLHSVSTKISSVEKSTANILYSADTSLELNYDNKPVLTDSRMKMFAWWFESRLAAVKNIKTFTLSHESLKIPGMEVCNIENLLALPDISDKKSDFLKLADNQFIFDKQKKSFFEEKLKAFPEKDFFEEFPFLKDYL